MISQSAGGILEVNSAHEALAELRNSGNMDDVIAAAMEAQGGVMVDDQIEIGGDLYTPEQIARIDSRRGANKYVLAAMIAAALGGMASDAYGKGLSAKRKAKIEKINLDRYNASRLSVGLQPVERDKALSDKMIEHFEWLDEHATIKDFYRPGFDGHKGTPIGNRMYMSMAGLNAQTGYDPKLASRNLIGDIGHRLKLLEGKLLSECDEDTPKDKIGLAFYQADDFWIFGIIPQFSELQRKEGDTSPFTTPAGNDVGLRYPGEGDTKINIHYTKVGMPLILDFPNGTQSNIEHVEATLYEGRKKNKGQRLRVVHTHNPKYDSKLTPSMKAYGNTIAIFPVPNTGKDKEKDYQTRSSGWLKQNKHYLLHTIVKMTGEKNSREYEHTFKTGRNIY